MKIKNIALAVSIAGFAVGFSDYRENIFFWMGRPVGAIGFIVFLIWTLLEKESALLDEQQRLIPAEFCSQSPIPAEGGAGSKNKSRHPAFVPAPTH